MGAASHDSRLGFHHPGDVQQRCAPGGVAHSLGHVHLSPQLVAALRQAVDIVAIAEAVPRKVAGPSAKSIAKTANAAQKRASLTRPSRRR